MMFLNNRNHKIILGFILVVLFLFLYSYVELSGLTTYLDTTESLQSVINDLGRWGPFSIIILIAGAVVMSPIPSAPIAITSGFIYGHTWGTVYVLIGAELGAIIAFCIARLLGYEIIQNKFGERINIRWLTSTKHMMLAVCISRLIPFISFDVVSYAAGLTKLSYLQFAIATLIGIIPASFLLAHFGSEMMVSDLNQIMLTIAILGLVTITPLVSLILKTIKSKSL